MKKILIKYSPTFVVLIIILIWIIYGNAIGLKQKKKSCEIEKSLSINKVVKQIVQDSINPPLKIIVFTDGTKLESIYTYGLWERVNIDDSIVKKPNSLEYLIFRYYGVDTFFVDVDCSTIKGPIW